jgi:hypothetical protein
MRNGQVLGQRAVHDFSDYCRGQKCQWQEKSDVPLGLAFAQCDFFDRSNCAASQLGNPLPGACNCNPNCIKILRVVVVGRPDAMRWTLDAPGAPGLFISTREGRQRPSREVVLRLQLDHRTLQLAGSEYFGTRHRANAPFQTGGGFHPRSGQGRASDRSRARTCRRAL